jgi:flagellar basal body-associated protein FliL
MEPIAIVKKRSRIWLIMALLIILMLLVAAALWFMGDAPATNISGASHPSLMLLSEARA